ncbi:sigma-54-dependent Fis family transcriptional regulator [Vibrio pectenicida]|uniref:Sigma-54-dependent Fis family transcriptional regulator n=1 Tax=Vibrio pectenicida TaxID=62763 RepID=A0A427U578_9VIBR|nr:sigma-54-dependent Fis family transcriptional regulator [Vibrio pectenicida]
MFNYGTDMEQHILQMDSWLASSPAKAKHILKPLLGLHYGDPEVDQAWQDARKVVGSGIHLLILGETGVGKGEFVKALHNYSRLSHKPLVMVNCAALPNDLIESELFGYAPGSFTGANPKGYSGRIRQADKGILFLDEIGDMSLQAQCRLLSLLQDKIVMPLGSTRSYNVDIEVISATHQNLQQLIAEGRFRQDLYYRLNGLTVRLPTLKQRKDKAQLIESIHAQYRKQAQKISKPVMERLMAYLWPGNIRELDNFIKVAALMADDSAEIEFKHLPQQWQQSLQSVSLVRESPSTDLNTTLNETVLDVYKSNQGNISKVARELGVSRNTVYRKLRALGY